jgi:hypothetical protein
VVELELFVCWMECRKLIVDGLVVSSNAGEIIVNRTSQEQV